METRTTVRKEALLAILQENRDKHRAVFEAALEGYREQCVVILRDKIAALSDGRSPTLQIMMSRPEDHTRDYDRVIKMLELSISETFEMDEQMFAQYVMDDWRWKRDWLRMSSRYASASTQQAYGVDVLEDD